MNKKLNLNEFSGITEMSFEEIQTIDGGGFWYDFFYVVGATGKAIWTFSKDAVEYQHSLPANLKK
ncbi:hypothetical protein [Sediminibacterium salmoneum]|uniref:hypothetical protein n=1 Tax=Sediminibacterium salmoneum TaxID=426421 RepID=UPI00047A1EDF|nr:hypothetical protein [Sediminibacterium salmoneum]